jgi:hypothetical protein
MSNPERGRHARNDLSARNFAKNVGHVVEELFALMLFASKRVGQESPALLDSVAILAVVEGLSDNDAVGFCAAASGTNNRTHKTTKSRDWNANEWR